MLSSLILGIFGSLDYNINSSSVGLIKSWLHLILYKAKSLAWLLFLAPVTWEYKVNAYSDIYINAKDEHW